MKQIQNKKRRSDSKVVTSHMTNQVRDTMKADDALLRKILKRARALQAKRGGNHWACQIASMEVSA